MLSAGRTVVVTVTVTALQGAGKETDGVLGRDGWRGRRCNNHRHWIA